MAELAPASGSPLLTQSTTGTPKRSSNATPSLDDKVEYMDGFGVPRRSQTYTRRMVLRGHTITMPEELIGPEDTEDDATTEQEEVKDEAELLREREAKQKANAEFKHQCKTEREEWIKEADKRIVERLALWYDGTKVGADADIVVITGGSVPCSPSKNGETFVDEYGNVRRKSVPKVVEKAEENEPGAEVRPADTVSIPVAPETDLASS